MQPTPPFWFTMRQAKIQPAGEKLYRLTAPNLPEAFLSIHSDDTGRWSGVLKMTADGPDVAVSGWNYDNPGDAWNAAFELYRNQLIV